MKAAFIRKTGGPEVIEWGDLPDPQVKEGEILVRTIAVAPAHIDTYIRAGKVSLTTSLSKPYILGYDVVGEVVKVGPGADFFHVGQKVWSNSCGMDGGQGSCSELVCRNANLFYPLPEGVDPVDAVAVVQSAAAVCRGFLGAAALKRGEILFVNGGAGNVGTALIQLGKARGLSVFVSTTGEEKIAWCKAQGADLIVDYKKGGIEEAVKKAAPQGIDVFWDTSWSPNLELGVNMMGQGGRIILSSGADARPALPVGLFYRKGGTVKGFNLLESTEHDLMVYAQIINRALEEKVLKPKIAKKMPLEKTREAHQLLEGKEGLWGKIVLTNQ